MSVSDPTNKIRKKTELELERHEAKYIVHPSQIPAIREFIRPFVFEDPNAVGFPPEYMVTTLQLDSPDYTLYAAKEHEALNRFKLRVRTYGDDGKCPIFMEIKRKIKGVIVKSRATVSSDVWSGDICLNPDRHIPFKKKKEEETYLNFVRLVNEIGARPVVRIRYIRESYLGKYDNYSRVTFDRRMQYQRARTWEVVPKQDQGVWWCMDSATALNRDFSGVVLELKTFSDAPQWMVDLAQKFDLVRIGFCKYFTAMRIESLYSGGQFSDASENCTYY